MLSLGIDIGSTSTEGIVLSQEDRVIAEYSTATRRGEQGVVAGLLEVAGHLASQTGQELTDFTSVGIGIPGVVNRETGTIANAVNLGINQTLLRDLIADEFSVPVYLDNDVKATVVAVGNLLKSTSVTYVNFGTGVASATLDGGRLLRGRNNRAGEIGHVVLNPNGDPCRCGQRGCIETVVGGRYLAPRMEMLELQWATLDKDSSPAGIAAHDQAVRVIARVAALVAVVYASDYIVLGGGVIHAAPWILPAVQNFLVTRSQNTTFPDYAEIAEEISVLDPNYRAAAIGAALIGRGGMEVE
ncbi:MAG: ROK family protein [Propionibacteriaceae bacterium]|jgi:predicted NBD/HSP70 family sugar kinase|nr:ROK family protein [Propionibacteriaceae bacterium]